MPAADYAASAIPSLDTRAGLGGRCIPQTYRRYANLYVHWSACRPQHPEFARPHKSCGQQRLLSAIPDQPTAKASCKAAFITTQGDLIDPVRSVREAVGEDFRICIAVHGKTTPTMAVDFCRRTEEYRRRGNAN